jgi:hypothetical protein
MKKKTKLVVIIWVSPFVAGAVCEFLPMWVAVPACLSLAIIYIGAWAQFADALKKEKEQGESK